MERLLVECVGSKQGEGKGWVVDQLSPRIPRRCKNIRARFVVGTLGLLSRAKMRLLKSEESMEVSESRGQGLYARVILYTSQQNKKWIVVKEPCYRVGFTRDRRVSIVHSLQ